MADENQVIKESKLKLLDYPVSILIMLGFISYSTIFMLSSFVYPYFILGHYLMSKTLLILFNSASLAMNGICIWGIIKRKHWVVQLIPVWFGIASIYPLAYLILSLNNFGEYITAYSKITGLYRLPFGEKPMAVVSLIPIAASLFSYILLIVFTNKKKKFFSNK
jgi:hypothetical protein